MCTASGETQHIHLLTQAVDLAVLADKGFFDAVYAATLKEVSQSICCIDGQN